MPAMPSNFVGRATFFALVVVFVFPSSSAQEGWKWPEKPANLQVLPKDMNGARLRPVMTGFTRALGVRCTHCHKGVEGQPLTSFDFASDENPNKGRAREMLRMLGDINARLKNIQPSGDKRVNMWCHTCHRGRPRPMTMVEELSEQYRAKGLKAAFAHYRELKTRYLTRGAYDFGEDPLNAFGYELLGTNATADAVEVFKLNAELFPQSGNAWDSLGEGLFKAKEYSQAKASYEKALAIDPRNENARKMLEQIKAAEAGAKK